MMLHAPETTAGKHSNTNRRVRRWLIEIDNRLRIDSLAYHLKGSSMFLLQIGMRLTARKIMLQVVVFYLQGDGIARVDDVLHVVEVICTRITGEKSKRIDDTSRDARLNKVFESEVRVFDNVMEKTCDFFFIRTAHQTNCEWMKDNRVSIQVQLTSMSLGRNL